MSDLSFVITKTSLLATRALVVLVHDKPGTVSSPREIALRLGESQAYMAKVLRLLVKAGILRAEHGSKGGVLLNRRANEITLLAIVEACQGTIAGSHCLEIGDLRIACAFHRASAELQETMVKVLSHWNLVQLASVQQPSKPLPGTVRCMMANFPVFKPKQESVRAKKKRRA